jgi:hypothetical protein
MRIIKEIVWISIFFHTGELFTEYIPFWRDCQEPYGQLVVVRTSKFEEREEWKCLKEGSLTSHLSKSDMTSSFVVWVSLSLHVLLLTWDLTWNVADTTNSGTLFQNPFRESFTFQNIFFRFSIGCPVFGIKGRERERDWHIYFSVLHIQIRYDLKACHV